MAHYSRKITKSDVQALIESMPADLAKNLESELSKNGISIGEINSLSPETEQYRNLRRIYNEYSSQADEQEALREQNSQSVSA